VPDILTLPDGSTITVSSKLAGLNTAKKWPGNVLKPFTHLYDTGSGQAAVEVDALYKAAPPVVNPPPPNGQPVTAAPFKTSAWFDDFSEGLNPAYWSTGKLAPGVTAPWNGDETACYDPANVAVKADGLHLSLTAKAQAGFKYSGACVNSNGKVKWSVGEYCGMRVVLPVANGKLLNWPQGWSDGQSWPKTAEIDIFEVLGGALEYHFHGPTGNGQGFGGALHEIGAYRNPAGTTDYYLDGKKVGSESAQGVTADHYLILVNSCGSLGGVTTPGVDAVWASIGLWTP
jgi:hypothetical protein